MLFASSSAQVLIEIGLVLGVLAGVLGWLGRRAKAADPSVLRTIRLSPQHAVYVVAVEDRRLLLGVGQGSAPTLLCDLGDRIKAVRNDATRADAGPRAGGDAFVAGASRGRGGWDHGA
jgi:flagellar biogenesis protein FliO